MSAPLHPLLALLPHGPEFRFVDALISVEPGVCGIGEYTLRGGEPFLRGHFPGNPLMPGVLLVEAGAQLLGIVAQSDPGWARFPVLKLTAIHVAKVFGTARPGETLCLRARVTGRMGALVQGRVTASIGARLVLQADVTLAGGDNG